MALSYEVSSIKNNWPRKHTELHGNNFINAFFFRVIPCASVAIISTFINLNQYQGVSLVHFLLCKSVHFYPMYTYCPNCLAIYQVTTGHLDQAAGQLRCGECRQIYRAIDYLFEDLAAARSVVETQRASSSQPQEVVDRYAPLEIPAHEEPGWEVTTEARPARRTHSGSWQGRSLSMGDIGSVLAIGLLLLLLGLQWVYFNRDVLAADDFWRPKLERFCEVLHCELPMRVDLAQIGIVERDVRQHPVVEDALLINVAIENRADFFQPYPLFEVSFTDKTGSPVAMRRFRPAEYLGEDIDPETGMSPQLPAQVMLEVIDPGDEAVSFQFGFL